jgi:hypothetical protein
VAPFHPLRHDARAFTARAGAAFAVFVTIVVVLLAGGTDQPLAVAEANKGAIGEAGAAAAAQTEAPTAAAPIPEPVPGASAPAAAVPPPAEPAPVTPAAPQPAPAPASKAAPVPDPTPASKAAPAPNIPPEEPQHSVGARSVGGGGDDDDDEGGRDDDRGGANHGGDDDDDSGASGGGDGDDDDDRGASGGGDGDDDDGWSGGGEGRGGDDDDDDDGGRGGDDDGDDDGRGGDDDDDDGRDDDDDDDDDGRGGDDDDDDGGRGDDDDDDRRGSGGGKGGDDDDGDDDDGPSPSGRGQVVTPPIGAAVQDPGDTDGDADNTQGGGQNVGTGTGELRDRPRAGERAGQDPQRLTTDGTGGAGDGAGGAGGSGGTPAGDTTGGDPAGAGTGAPATAGDTPGAEGGAGEAGAGGDAGGGAGGDGAQDNDGEGSGQGEGDSLGPSDFVVTPIEELVNVVPDELKAALAALAALSVMLGTAYLLSALRARRLARQRRELLQEVGLLQTALLPPVPDKVGALLTSVAYRPADGPGAGGDFYDVLPLPGGRVGFILGDVSGHGRGALARTAFMRYTLRAYLEAGLEPRVALQVAGRVIDENLGGDFATVLLAVHDPETGSLTYATAGHPAPIVVGPQPHEPVTAGSSPPIGVGVRTGLRQTTVPLVPGSVAALFTDGLMEARTEDGILGRERLEGLLKEIDDDPSAHRLIERVAAEATLLSDDMAAVVVTPTAGVTAGLFRTEQLELSTRELDGPIARRFLEATGLPEADVAAAEREARELADRFGGVVLHVVYGNRLSVEVLPRNVESIEAASRRVSAGTAQ